MPARDIEIDRAGRALLPAGFVRILVGNDCRHALIGTPGIRRGNRQCDAYNPSYHAAYANKSASLHSEQVKLSGAPILDALRGW
jgi:hypothetical protein